MKPKKNRFIVTAAASIGLASAAFADSGTWNTTTTPAAWNLDTNWTGNVIADGAWNTADFSQLDITANTTVNVTAGRTIGNLTFGDTAIATAGSWVLAGGGGTLTLDGTTPTITVNALGTAKNVNITALLAGTSGFTKSGSGMLILDNAGNSISGPVTLSSGLLQLHSAALTNTSGVNINGGTLVLATSSANVVGGTITFGGGMFQHNNNPGTDYSNQFSTAANQQYKITTISAVSATYNGVLSSVGGTLTKSGAGTLILASANTFTGTTTVTGGNLTLNNALALQNSAVDSTASVVGNATTGLVLSGVTTPTFGGLIGSKSLSTLFNTATGAYISVTGLTLNPGTGASHSYSGVISDGAAGMSLTKTGEGSQTLSGTNTYTGGTNVNAGTLAIANAAALGSGTVTFTGNSALKAGGAINLANTVTINTSVIGTLDTNSFALTLSGALTGPGNLIKSGTGTLTLTGGTSNTLGGTITVNAGTLGSQNSASLQNLAGTITVAPGASFDAKAAFGASIANGFILSGTGSGTLNHGALNIRENANLSGAITLTADTKITHDWNIATVSGSITGTNTNLELKTLEATQLGFVMSGPISLGTGALTLTGIGTSGAADFAISGSNSFTGGTLLKGGRVSFNNASALGNGTVTFMSNTSLAGTANMTHANAITVNSGVAATLEASASTAFVQSGAVTGDGTLIKSGLGTVTLSGGLPNTFTGPIDVNAGTLGVLNGASIKNITGAITVAAGATFDAKQGFDSNNFAQNISIAGSGSGISNHGALNVRENANLAGAVTLNANSKITHDWNNGTISGTITGTNTNLQLTTLVSGQPPLFLTGPINLGTGGVTVTGAGGLSTINLSGTLNYTGETVVTSGTLKLSGTARLADSSTVRITSGAVLDLDFSGTDTVADLYLGGLQKLPGTYGSLSSTADNKSADFSGSGTLSVGPSSPSYATWAAINAGGELPGLDFDDDGVSNGIEYFMGETGSSFTPNPSLTDGKVTWIRNPSALATYIVQTSVNLKDEVVSGDGGWAPAASGVVDNGTSVEYTVPDGDPKRFARLKVTVTP